MCGTSLQEAIFQLQKPDMETGTRAVVEEAAQLLADERGVKTNGTAQSQALQEDVVLTRIADKLTQTVSQALLAAFRDVRQHLARDARPEHPVGGAIG
jgi:hypothetical protein